MLNKLKSLWKNGVYKLLAFLITYIGQGCIRLLLMTCKWQVEGIEEFKNIASRNKCILMLWHNRLALTPFILSRFAPHFIYAALVSNSRDGELISSVVRSYKTGRTIRVSHNARHQALLEMIDHLEKKKEIIIVTPDGPRGPSYRIKPGVALAAIETEAHVIPLTWTSTCFWELNTWDKLRLPKPFSTIQVKFGQSTCFPKESNIELKSAQAVLQSALQSL
jgi:lysophospholipid acyltransferase (LPLAT)-like uncharacterized protein